MSHRAACVARCGHENDVLPAVSGEFATGTLAHKVAHQPRHEPRAEIFECQCRPVEELEHCYALVEAHQRHREIERVFDDRPKLFGRNLVPTSARPTSKEISVNDILPSASKNSGGRTGISFGM